MPLNANDYNEGATTNNNWVGKHEALIDAVVPEVNTYEPFKTSLNIKLLELETAKQNLQGAMNG